MNDWISPRPPEESIRFLKDVSCLLSRLGGPLTKGLSALIEEDKFLEAVNYRFDYLSDTTLRDFTLARQVHALVQKQEFMDLGVDTRRAAEIKFWEMEERCRMTNDRLDANQLSAGSWPVISRARTIIAKILGRVPPFGSLRFSFGPGATSAVKSRVASPRAKLSARLACSRESVPHVGRLLDEVPSWALHHSACKEEERLQFETTDCDYTFIHHVPVDVHVGKLTYVPKDARSMRPIIVEPTLNGFVQKGIGTYLKGRLLRCAGIDLKSQDRNREFARIGSQYQQFATVDMSSASDTVSRSVVGKLLPLEWFEFLLSWTTGEVGTSDGPRELHKFSSMGNGFTFELESLIFFSLAKACTELLDLRPEVCTFGDDVIVDSRAYTLFAETLNDLGFLVNEEKSFASGPFRESCGADWLDGNSIRPFYWKKPVSERTLYTFHNFAIRNGERELAELILGWTCPAQRLFGPDGYGDGHLVGSYNLRRGRKLRRAGWEGGFFDTYALRPKRLKKRYAADEVYPSYSVYTRSGERSLTDPDIVRGSDGYAKVSVYTLARSIFGPSLEPFGSQEPDLDLR